MDRRRNRKRISAVVLFASLVATRAIAQDAVPGIRCEGDEVVFDAGTNGGVPFVQFVKLAQRVTGRTFLLDESQQAQIEAATGPTGPIQLLGTLRIQKSSFYSFFETIVSLKGWVCMPRNVGDTEFVELVLRDGPRRDLINKAVRLVAAADLEAYRDQPSAYLITKLRTAHVDAVFASGILNKVFTVPDGLTRFAAVGPRALVISGFGPQVWAITQMVASVDVPGETAQAVLRVIELEYRSAEELEPILSSLLSERTKIQAKAGGGADEAADRVVPTKILRSPHTNALIVHAHPERVREIEDMVAQLDTRVAASDSEFHVYRLVNTLAKDMRETLHDFIQQSARAGALVGHDARPPVIQADEKGNALVISANRTQYREIVALVEKLDQRQPQVLVEAALIELSTQDLDALGVELGLMNNAGGPFGFSSFGLSTLQDTDGNGLPDLRLPNFADPLRGLTGGILSSGDFSIPVFLRAQTSRRETNVLSVPSVLVTDNETARVSSKESVATVETTVTLGSQSPVRTFDEYASSGIELAVTPRISGRDHVRLEIELEVSRFIGTARSGDLPPPRTTRTIKTSVTMPSGDTMVCGGMIDDAQGDTTGGVPFLKDLPLLGSLFRSKESTSSKMNLYFFVTPHILFEEDFSDLASLTFKKKLEAARYIGHRRVRRVDPDWDVRLEDAATTIEDIDRLGGFDIPTYARPGS